MPDGRLQKSKSFQQFQLYGGVYNAPQPYAEDRKKDKALDIFITSMQKNS
jgi:hypothetical protein